MTTQIASTGSSLPTPNLSPSASANPSPILSVIKSPATSTLELDFDSGDGWKMPECWGHRGFCYVPIHLISLQSYLTPLFTCTITHASCFTLVIIPAENTRGSFVEACKAGADGIETDVYITSDNVLVMFHDPELRRTTDGTGRIDKQPWHGVLEHVRTRKKPHQPIPLFTDVLDLLLEPSNVRVKLNLDCKIQNDPVKLFGLVRAVLERYDNWQNRLAPRIVLGIWHKPKYIAPAIEILPFLPRYAISLSLPEIRQYFFNDCHGFSIRYECLASADGARFRQECRDTSKSICAWTVNRREEMRECARWGVKSVISDKPALWMEVKAEIEKDRKRALRPTIQTHVLPFLLKKNYGFAYKALGREEIEYLEREGGKFDTVDIPSASLRIVTPANILAK